LEHSPLYAYENNGAEKPPVSWLNKLAAIEGLLDSRMSPELEDAGGDIGWIPHRLPCHNDENIPTKIAR
jgi:hypothetical protein